MEKTTQTATRVEGLEGVWALSSSASLSRNGKINLRVVDHELEELIVEHIGSYLITTRRTTESSLCINYYQVSVDENSFYLAKFGEIPVSSGSLEYQHLNSKLETAG